MEIIIKKQETKKIPLYKAALSDYLLQCPSFCSP